MESAEEDKKSFGINKAKLIVLYRELFLGLFLTFDLIIFTQDEFLSFNRIIDIKVKSQRVRNSTVTEINSFKIGHQKS